MILSRLFSCPMTILGDRAQTMDDEAQDVCRFLPKLLGQGVRVIEMKKGYRNTVEIAQYAEQLLGCHCGEFLERHGKPVEEQEFAAWRDAILAVVRQADLTEDGFETAAVLTMTEKEAFAAAALLREAGMELSYIDRDSTSFKKGLTVTTFYLAKGLEFDQVFAVMPIEEVPMKKH